MLQQSLNSDETILAEATDGTKLVVYEPVSEVDVGDREDAITINLPALDHSEGAIRFVDEETSSTRDTEYMFREARLAFGLWLRCGPFDEPEGSAVPKEIATDGQDAITAYIHLNKGIPLSREGTASICGVTKQTVSDRLSRIRWRPDLEGLEEGGST